MITIKDVKRAEKHGVSHKLLRERIGRGLDKETAITKPNKKRVPIKWRDLADRNNIHRATFYARRRKGWSDYDAATIKPGTIKPGAIKRSGRKKDMRIYALYKGDEFLHMGTLDELAAKMNRTRKSIQHLKTPAYKKKNAHGRWLSLVCVDDEED